MSNKEMTNTIATPANPIAERLQELVDKLVASKRVKNFPDFARKAKLHYPNIFEVRQGKRSITVEMVIAICTTFGVSADWILLGKEEMTLLMEIKKEMEALKNKTVSLESQVQNREIIGKFKGKKGVPPQIAPLDNE